MSTTARTTSSSTKTPKSFLAKKKARDKLNKAEISAKSSGHAQLVSWTNEEVVVWFKQRGYGEYVTLVKHYGLTGAELAIMQVHDFNEIGIQYGPSKRELVDYRDMLIESYNEYAVVNKQVMKNFQLSPLNLNNLPQDDQVVSFRKRDLPDDPVHEKLLISPRLRQQEETSSDESSFELEDPMQVTVGVMEAMGTDETSENSTSSQSTAITHQKPLTISEQYKLFLQSKLEGKTEDEALSQINERIKEQIESEIFMQMSHTTNTTTTTGTGTTTSGHNTGSKSKDDDSSKSIHSAPHQMEELLSKVEKKSIIN